MSDVFLEFYCSAKEFHSYDSNSFSYIPHCIPSVLNVNFISAVVIEHSCTVQSVCKCFNVSVHRATQLCTRYVHTLSTLHTSQHCSSVYVISMKLFSRGAVGGQECRLVRLLEKGLPPTKQCMIPSLLRNKEHTIDTFRGNMFNNHSTTCHSHSVQYLQTKVSPIATRHAVW